jgi:hypothetical protein
MVYAVVINYIPENSTSGKGHAVVINKIQGVKPWEGVYH